MQVNVGEHGVIELSDVFEPIILHTPAGPYGLRQCNGDIEVSHTDGLVYPGPKSYSIAADPARRHVYYAHPVTEYGTELERFDTLTLEDLGFDVVNPNSEPILNRYHAAKMRRGAIDGSDDPMQVFYDEIDKCSALAFRALPNGALTRGVASEIAHARRMGLPIIELSLGNPRHVMSMEDTRDYIAAQNHIDITFDAWEAANG